MSLTRVAPDEAKTLLDGGYRYLDVRSVPEFEAGHPSDAFNIPFMHRTASGMQPNPDFLDVVRANFELTDKIVVGCQGGGRSLRAAQAMMAAGFADVVDQRAGFGGCRGPDGNPEPGWQSAGLPVSTRHAEGRGYAELAAKAGKTFP